MAEWFDDFDCLFNCSLGGFWALNEVKRFEVPNSEFSLWLILFVGFWIKGNILIVNILFSLEILFVCNSFHPKSQAFNWITQRPDNYMKRIHALECRSKFSRIIIWKSEIRRLQPINSTKFSRNSDTAANIWANSHRRASGSNQSSLTPWTSSNTSELIPWIKPSAP